MSEPVHTGHAAAEAPDHADKAGKRSLPRRIGCWLLVVIWFAILLTPCGLFYLAANGEIRLQHSQAPNPYAHPRLLISLISESENRGLRIESSTVQSGENELAACVETSVTFLLWETRDGNQNTQFCDCYSRPLADAAWALQSTYGTACRETG